MCPRFFYRWVVRLGFAVIALGMSVVACANEPMATTTTIPAVTSTTPQVTTSSLLPGTSTSPAVTSATTMPIDIEVRGGEIIGVDHFEVTTGSTFTIRVVSDVADELHVHGYDLFYELEPGVPVEVSFVADTPGVFEAELETTHIRLFEIEVSG